MIKKFLNSLCVATALLSAVSCGDIMEMVGDITGEDNNSITSFSITPSKLSIKAEGGEATIAFTAPDVWSVSSTQDWLSFNPSAGTSGETIVTITAQANKSGKERSADVVVESAKFRASMTVSQAPEEGEVPPGPNPPDSTTTATAKWYLIGSFQDWNVSTSLEMKEVKDGVYSIDVTFPENTEFKFLKDQDPNWTVNLGSAQWASGNVSPAIKADETISLVQDGANILFVPGGDVSITLDVNNNTAVLTGGNPDNPPTTETVWSVIGTIYGSNWDTDYDLSWDGDTEHPTYYARVYYEDGQEFKFRQNHDWVDPDWGFGPVIMPEPAILNLVGQGPNITLPWTGYWDIYLTPDKGELQFYPAEDLNWQYFLNPDGSVSEITFSSAVLESAITGRIKYYEVNGVRTCKTETNGVGVLGEGGRDWYFVWYTDSDRIKLPLQMSGLTDDTYGEAVVMSPYYYYGVYAAATNPDLGTYFDFIEKYPGYPEGYYDGNGGFYFGVMWYLFVDHGIGYKCQSYDVLAEANGFERYDYSGSMNIGTADKGVREVSFTVGKDIASVRYLFFDEKIDDDEKALGIATQLAEGSIEYNVINEFTTEDGKHYHASVYYTAEVPGYHTVIAVGLDAAGNWYFWYYYWFNLDPYVDPSNYTWTTLGTAEYTDDFIASLFDIENLTWGVEIEKCDQDPTRLRLIYPYDNKFEYNEEGDWAEDKSYDIEIVVLEDNRVYFVPQEIGVNWGYGMFSIASYAGYLIGNGYGLDEVDPELFGTLSEGVITFPEKSLLISMAEYNDGGWYYAGIHNAFRLVLPYALGADTSAPKKVAAPAARTVSKAKKVSFKKEESHGNGGKAVKPKPTLERVN